MTLMQKTKITDSSLASWMRSTANNASKIHLIFLGLYGAYIIFSDLWDLIASTIALQRWLVFLLMATAFSLCYKASCIELKTVGFYRRIVWVLVITDIALASFSIYTQRGMASRGVALYALAIVTSAYLLKLRSLLTAASLAAASYILSAWWYFHTHFNEGYRAELFFEVGFYAFCMLTLVALLWNLVHPSKNTHR